MGIDDYLELLSEDIVISNLPFYPMRDENGNLYQNSTIRGFLNGIDVRDITENGNPEYSASNGGDFRGECNWLNETFNLSRKPMIEYVIPESEEEIPDDGFNGCVTLKKLTLHKDIQHIGDRAFNGIDFRYAYKTPTGEIIFSKELLKDFPDSTQFYKVEISEALTNKYQIKELPALVAFENGKMMGKIEGYIDEDNKEKLMNEIQALKNK